MQIEESLVSSVEEKNLNDDIDYIFQEIYEGNTEKQDLLDNILSNTEQEKTTEFSMDSLINEILSPIVDAEENTPNLKQNQIDSTTVSDEESTQLDIQIDSKISNLLTELLEITENTTSPIVENVIQPEEIIEEPTEEPVIEVLEEPIIEPIIEVSEGLIEEPIIEISEEPLVRSTPETNTSTTSETSEESLKNTIASLSKIDSTENKEETALTVSPRSLSKFYLIKKKIKIALSKLFRFGVNPS